MQRSGSREKDRRKMRERERKEKKGRLRGYKGMRKKVRGSRDKGSR